MQKTTTRFWLPGARVGLVALLCFGGAACNTVTGAGGFVDTTRAAMQLAVGTLNDSAGTFTGTPNTYLNAVATFRNQFGASAFLNPGAATLSGPGGLSLALGSIFAYGQTPGTNGVGGQPPAYTPANPVAGGYATGFIVTKTAQPLSGPYSISTTVQNNGQNRRFAANAVLPAAPVVLGNEVAPSFASSGASGGGTFSVAVPAGVTETLIVVLSGSTEVATVEAKGTTAVVPAGTLNPGTPYTAFAIGADYPLVEAGPPASTAMRPSIAGQGGTADLTVSAGSSFTQ